MEGRSSPLRVIHRMLSIFSIATRVAQLTFKNYKKLLFRLGLCFSPALIHRIQLSPGTFQTVFFASDIDRSGSIQLDQFIKVVMEKDS